MKIVLATGIYPPIIGGPATYVLALAGELVKQGVGVVVITYGEDSKIPRPRQNAVGLANGEAGRARDPASAETTAGRQDSKQEWEVVRVSKSGGPVCRWRRYANALRQHASDADAVIAFSSVSCGVPLWMAGLKKPKKILRLGGDFLWERYTDHGGKKTLREFYEHMPTVCSFVRLFVQRLLRTFDHIVFSTRFQEEMYEKHYKSLPPHSVIENAVPAPRPTAAGRASSQLRAPGQHTPFRLLWMGRFVGFKNLPILLEAVSRLDGVTLTLVGEGQLLSMLKAKSHKLPVQFLELVHGEEKQNIFAEHDLLVLPSLTEISPNVALEARAAGLPVLLTEETGLSEKLREGMAVRDLSTPRGIIEAITGVREHYEEIAVAAAGHPSTRMWGDVAEEWTRLLSTLF